MAKTSTREAAVARGKTFEALLRDPKKTEKESIEFLKKDEPIIHTAKTAEKLGIRIPVRFDNQEDRETCLEILRLILEQEARDRYRYGFPTKEERFLTTRISGIFGNLTKSSTPAFEENLERHSEPRYSETEKERKEKKQEKILAVNCVKAEAILYRLDYISHQELHQTSAAKLARPPKTTAEQKDEAIERGEEFSILTGSHQKFKDMIRYIRDNPYPIIHNDEAIKTLGVWVVDETKPIRRKAVMELLETILRKEQKDRAEHPELINGPTFLERTTGYWGGLPYAKVNPNIFYLEFDPNSEQHQTYRKEVEALAKKVASEQDTTRSRSDSSGTESSAGTDGRATESASSTPEAPRHAPPDPSSEEPPLEPSKSTLPPATVITEPTAAGVRKRRHKK